MVSRLNLQIQPSTRQQYLNVFVSLNVDSRYTFGGSHEEACRGVEVLVQEAPMDILNALQLLGIEDRMDRDHVSILAPTQACA